MPTELSPHITGRRACGFLLVPLVLTVLLSGCGLLPSPLAHSQGSLEDLSRAVLDAVERKDPQRLLDLALSREEFEEVVWPELPAARPERNLTPDFVWADLAPKSRRMLSATLAAHGGRRYELVGVRFLGESTPYQSYLVHREAELTVRGADGEMRDVRLFGSIIEKSGRFKVFSYVVEN